MLKSFKKVGEVMSRVVSKGKCFAAVLGTGLFFADAKAATDIVTYNSEGGSITWDFSSILEMMFSNIGRLRARFSVRGGFVVFCCSFFSGLYAFVFQYLF